MLMCNSWFITDPDIITGNQQMTDWKYYKDIIQLFVLLLKAGCLVKHQAWSWLGVARNPVIKCRNRITCWVITISVTHNSTLWAELCLVNISLYHNLMTATVEGQFLLWVTRKNKYQKKTCSKVSGTWIHGDSSYFRMTAKTMSE